jgi:transcriptional regulator with XRE-family HTH domain
MSEKPLKVPTPAEIRAARDAAGLTQAAAAELVHLKAQQRWAEYESGVNNIGLSTWELFLIKTGQQSLARRRS